MYTACNTQSSIAIKAPISSAKTQIDSCEFQRQEIRDSYKLLPQYSKLKLGINPTIFKYLLLLTFHTNFNHLFY
jgi:hypothetical protein